MMFIVTAHHSQPRIPLLSANTQHQCSASSA